jgi:hypothetical protein
MWKAAYLVAFLALGAMLSGCGEEQSLSKEFLQRLDLHDGLLLLGEGRRSQEGHRLPQDQRGSQTVRV